MKISPFSIEFGDAHHGTWGSDVSIIGRNYHLRRPFLRPHSVSLGAHGRVETVDPAIIAPSEPLLTVVTIQKSSNPDSIRNKQRLWTYALEDMEAFYGDTMFHSDESPEVLLARMAVCEAVSEYSKHGLDILDLVGFGIFLD